MIIFIRISLEDKESEKSKVFWVTSEAVPHVNNMPEFLDISEELIRKISKSSIIHEFQNYENDTKRLKEIIKEETNTNRPVVFITPEKELYADIVGGNGNLVHVGISRIVNVIDWKAKGHRTHFPQIYKIFMDTVSFTGRTIEKVFREYSIDLAIVELLGKYAAKKLEDLPIRVRYSRDVSEFDAMWHLDDLVQPIETNGKIIMPSEFIREIYGGLKSCNELEEYREMLKRYGIREEQTSPNLFLELSRPNSYLSRSFHSTTECVEDTISLIQRMEKIYTGGNELWR